MLNRLFICCVVLFGALQLGFAEVLAQERQSAWMFYCKFPKPVTEDEQKKQDCWAQSMIVGTQSGGEDGEVDGKLYFQVHRSEGQWLMRLFFTEKDVGELLLLATPVGEHVLVVGKMAVIAVEEKGTWAELLLAEHELRWLTDYVSLGLHWTGVSSKKQNGYGYFNVMSTDGLHAVLSELTRWQESSGKGG